MQHTYVSITQIDQLYFSSCEGCTLSCCDGSRFLFAPLILEDFEEVYPYFPIVFGQINDEWRTLILFTLGSGGCRYHKEGKCEIYDSRPPACRIYPLSPYYEDILVDTSCHAIRTEGGEFLASNGALSSSFYHKRLEGFEAKRQATQGYLKTLEAGFKPLGVIGGMRVFRYSGEEDSHYLRMHYDSLRLLPELTG